MDRRRFIDFLAGAAAAAFFFMDLLRIAILKFEPIPLLFLFQEAPQLDLYSHNKHFGSTKGGAFDRFQNGAKSIQHFPASRVHREAGARNEPHASEAPGIALT